MKRRKMGLLKHPDTISETLPERELPAYASELKTSDLIEMLHTISDYISVSPRTPLNTPCPYCGELVETAEHSPDTLAEDLTIIAFELRRRARDARIYRKRGSELCGRNRI